MFFLHLLAQTPATGDSTFALFAQYGVLGIAVLVLAAFARNAYNREKERADQAYAEVLRLNMVMAERMVPALEHATEAVREIRDVTLRAQRAREL